MTIRQLRSSLVRPLALLVIAVAVYWRTAYPTITWWDSSSYSLAAATLGIPSQPGSLFLTLLGWPIAKLSPATAVAHSLNVLAGALAALTTMLVAPSSPRLLGRGSKGQRPRRICR
jgi:hypothetical protein